MSNTLLPDPQLAKLEPAFAALAKYDRGSGRAALIPIDDAVAAANLNASARPALEKRLLQALASAPSNAARDYICSKLAWIGSDASVPALVQLLPNAEVSAPARTALEAIGGATAIKALRKALPTLPVRQKIGGLHSLGALRDAGSVRVMKTLLRDADGDVARAAVVALGNIGSVAAARALRDFAPGVPVALRAGYGDAALVCAEQLVRAGQKKEARALCQTLNATGFPKHVREAALRTSPA